MKNLKTKILIPINNIITFIINHLKIKNKVFKKSNNNIKNKYINMYEIKNKKNYLLFQKNLENFFNEIRK